MTCYQIPGGYVCDGYDAALAGELGPVDPWMGRMDFRRLQPYPVMDGFHRYDGITSWIVAWCNTVEDARLLCTTLRAQKMAGLRP